MEYSQDELKKYVPIAESIAQTFGKNCEVVIHDLKSPRNSVIYTINNHVTGRELGQSFDHLVTQVLLSKESKNDFVANYRTKNVNNQTIKSTTALLRDSKNEVIGAFCINYDIEALMEMKNFIEDFTKVENKKIENDQEVEVVSNVWNIVNNIIDKTIPENDTRIMKREDKIEIIQFLNEKDVFLIKGALEKVATRLKVSNPTLYVYLEEVRNLDQEGVF